MQSIYNSGGRSFWIHNTGPLGCYAFVFLYSPSAPALKDSAGCVKPYNELAQYFNLKLKEAVVQLRKAFPSAAFTYVDVYSIKYSLFKEPEKYGTSVSHTTYGMEEVRITQHCIEDLNLFFFFFSLFITSRIYIIFT